MGFYMSFYMKTRPNCITLVTIIDDLLHNLIFFFKQIIFAMMTVSFAEVRTKFCEKKSHSYSRKAGVFVDKMHIKNHTDQWCLQNCDPRKVTELEEVSYVHACMHAHTTYTHILNKICFTCVAGLLLHIKHDQSLLMQI